jgi:hypothetical protein
MPLPDDRRCTAKLENNWRCSNRAVADSLCVLHHPRRKQEDALRQQTEVLAKQAAARGREACRVGMHDFWCQVAICALMQYLQKAAPEYCDALVRRLGE